MNMFVCTTVFVIVFFSTVVCTILFYTILKEKYFMEDTKKSSKFVEKFSEIASVVGRQRHLAAIRDGFITLMPILILGSLITLINNIPIGQWMQPDDSGEMVSTFKYLADFFREHKALEWIPAMNGHIWGGTFAIMALLAVFSISYQLAKQIDPNTNALAAAITALGVHLSVAPTLDYNYAGTVSLFVGLILCLITTEIFVRLSRNKKLHIKMPQGVPPAVSKSFAALLPTLITVTAINLVFAVFETYLKHNIFDWFNDTLMGMFSTASGSIWFGLIIVILIHLFWMAGLHGANMFTGIISAFTLAYAIPGNLAYVQNGNSGEMFIFNNVFMDVFINMGGSGVGLAIVFAILIAGRRSSSYRTIGRISVAPGVFNINESVLFGLPVVLNPVMLIPFVLAPVACLLIAYISTAIGIIPPVAYVIPWTTPPLISGYLATLSWMGPVIQLINLAVATLIYIPFIRIAVKIDENLALEQQAQAYVEETNSNEDNNSLDLQTE